MNNVSTEMRKHNSAPGPLGRVAECYALGLCTLLS